MRRHPRTRKTLKWTSASLLTLLLAAWAFSMSAWLYYVGDRFIVGLASGRIDVQWSSGDPRNTALTWTPDFDHPAFLIRPALRSFAKDVVGKGPTGWAAGRFVDRRPYNEQLGAALPGFHQKTFPAFTTQYVRSIGATTMRGFVFPLWIVFVLGLIPTLWLFWRDRPSPSGHCQTCRYDLRGSCAHRCPECGAYVPEWLEANARKT